MAERRYFSAKFWWLLAASLFLLLTGFGVRIAENEQVGYTHDASMWVFAAAGICAYCAGLTLFSRRRRT